MATTETEIDKIHRRLIANDPSLTILNLCCRYLHNHGAAALANALKHNTHVVVIMLGGNMISDRGVKHLSMSLPSSVKYLHLSNNQIGADGAKAMTHLHHLRVLDLRYNHILDQGAMHITQLLENPCCKLECLMLSGNSIAETGMKSLASAMHNNSSLQSIYLSQGCSLPMEAYAAFRNMSRVNQTLQIIQIDSIEGVMDIQQVLTLYRWSRAFLMNENGIKATYWSTILRKFADAPEVLHYVLRGRPEVLLLSNTQ